MNKTIYIIRHGQTDLNFRGVVQGRGMDTDLNDLGRSQAEAFYQYYKNVPFDHIYTSTLKRTHQTVRNFIEKDIPWTQLSGLDEIGWGIYEGVESSDAVKLAFADMLGSWVSGRLAQKFENGESPEDVKLRQLEAFEHILQNELASNILVCMHGRAMRILLCVLLDRPLSEMDEFPHSNTTLYKLEYDGKKFSIIEFNNTDHLT
ncbi:putative phosphoglycerate mutase [Arcticibacter pallidicorallinus]|uniref:Putative phosphoglycerate mutase n=1 Tax=Arcticibacter pallidicorallinus TaxID=1259464 RepID=A0A2T0TXH4_9SPHI|nr:histidine phosphatase family protein [Arcticibacter pallidicorallinus]PRY50396.1 putative phosphoglycerate mutase [Arcticibacter pallidicorallinus]